MGILLDISERKVAEEDLKEAQERFRQLADNLEAVFWMRPLDERQIIYINAAYERIWGRTIDSLMERPEIWLEAVHPEDREHLRQRIKRKSAEEFGEDEYRIIRPDGQVRWINTRTFPVRDGRGEIYRVAGISVDITDAQAGGRGAEGPRRPNTATWWSRSRPSLILRPWIILPAPGLFEPPNRGYPGLHARRNGWPTRRCTKTGSIPKTGTGC